MPMRYKLNDWALVSAANPYSAPELQVQCLMGKVENHPLKDDGVTIVTSRIVGKYEDCIVTKTGSLVELGEPRAEYAASFPNAKQRLMDSAPQCCLRWDGSIR